MTPSAIVPKGSQALLLLALTELTREAEDEEEAAEPELKTEEVLKRESTSA